MNCVHSTFRDKKSNYSNYLACHLGCDYACAHPWSTPIFIKCVIPQVNHMIKKATDKNDGQQYTSNHPS